jgi:hypothetical protein
MTEETKMLDRRAQLTEKLCEIMDLYTRGSTVHSLVTTDLCVLWANISVADDFIAKTIQTTDVGAAHYQLKQNPKNVFKITTNDLKFVSEHSCQTRRHDGKKTFFDFVTIYKPSSGMENLVLYIRKVSANFM